jgi:hypothetical protein
MKKDEYILLVSLHADPSMPSGVGEGGGTHSYIRELMVGMVTKERNCIIVTRKQAPHLSSKEEIGKFISLYRIEIGNDWILDKKELNKYHKESLSQIEYIIKTTQRKLIAIHSVYWNSGRVAMELSKRYKIPYLHTIISNGKRRVKEGAVNIATERIEIETLVFNNAQYIFSITKSEKEDIVSLYDVPPEKIVVVGRVIDKAFLSPSHDDTGIPQKHKLSK